MAKIPSIAYLVIGIIVAVIASRVEGMKIFVYIGYFMIAYGAARVLVKYVLKKDEPEKGKGKYNQLPENGKVPLKKANKKYDLYGYIGYCPTCQTPMRKINIYCHRCGRKQQF